MIKKLSAAAALAALIVSGAFAQEDFRISLGAGGYFSNDFGGGVKTEVLGISSSIKMPYLGGGGFLFFDLTYAELSFGYFAGNTEWEVESTIITSSSKYALSHLNISLLGKYPIEVGDSMKFSPMLGIDYVYRLSMKDDNGIGAVTDVLEKYNALWFKLGGGLDFAITDNIFLRGELLYGLRLANEYEKDSKAAGGSAVTTLPGHGLTVKIAVGYAF